jgi:hypothetical protein
MGHRHGSNAGDLAELIVCHLPAAQCRGIHTDEHLGDRATPLSPPRDDLDQRVSARPLV